MAKSFRAGRYVTIEDKLYSLPVDEIKKIVRHKVYLANRNLKKLRERTGRTGEYIPSLESVVLNENEKFKIPRQKGQTTYNYKQMLLSKLKEVEYFNRLKTSSLSKLNAYQKEVKQEFEKKFTTSIENEKKFWQLYNDFQKTKNQDGLLSSESVLRAIDKRFLKLDSYKQKKRIYELIESEAEQNEKIRQKQSNAVYFKLSTD